MEKIIGIFAGYKEVEEEMSVKERWSGTKQIVIQSDELISLLLPSLKSDGNILISYLFGSRTSSAQISTSDIDLAIYTSNSFLWENYYILYGNLTQKLHSDRLDLVWMNKAEPILNFEIIKTGRVLFYTDAVLLNNFELKTKKIFYDYSFYLHKHQVYSVIPGVKKHGL